MEAIMPTLAIRSSCPRMLFMTVPIHHIQHCSPGKLRRVMPAVNTCRLSFCRLQAAARVWCRRLAKQQPLTALDVSSRHPAPVDMHAARDGRPATPLVMQHCAGHQDGHVYCPLRGHYCTRYTCSLQASSSHLLTPSQLWDQLGLPGRLWRAWDTEGNDLLLHTPFAGRGLWLQRG